VAAVRSAKAYKYAYEAQDAAQQWADFFLGGMDFAGQAGCGPLIPKKDDLIKKAFGPLSDAADELIPGGMNYQSLPCPAKGCRGCKGPKCKNDDKNSKTADQPTQTTQKTQPESTNDPAKTTDASKSSPTSSDAGSSTNSDAGSSTSSDSTSSTSSVTPTSTMDCKAVAAKDTGEEENPESDARRRSYPINPNFNRLDKRARPKSAKACGIDLQSFSYPAFGEWGDGMPTPKKYGFNTRDSCDNYEWNNPDSGTEVKYETEHVLEWQIVANFFTTMGEDITDEFEHPNPEKKGDKLKFCEYWKESWQFTRDQGMDDPDPAAAAAPTPVTGPDGKQVDPPEKIKRKPLEWLAIQYPYKDTKGGGTGQMWLEELTLLEKKINGENKNPVRIILLVWRTICADLILFP
jgi:hypothetical protein